jgi:3-methyladenine DNA glycosylase AlkD
MDAQEETGVDDIIRRVRIELQQNADPEKKAGGERFFKEDVTLYGVTISTVNRIANSCLPDVKRLSKQEVFSVCTELWQSGFLEEAFIACNWSYALRKSFVPDDFDVFQRWITEYVKNWATCDTLCNHTVGAFVDMYPSYVQSLKTWARLDNRWLRRAAAVTLIIPARHGRFLDDVFDIAEILLRDSDDLVRKGYGWMLKAASESHQAEVLEYVIRRKDVMPRTALRYAVEKMPAELRARAMAK